MGNDREFLRENYENLVNAVIATAASDYKSKKRRLNRLNEKRRTPMLTDTNREVIDKEVWAVRGEIRTLTKFFRTSPWMSMVSVDGEYILENLNKLLAEEGC